MSDLLEGALFAAAVVGVGIGGYYLFARFCGRYYE